MVKPLAFKGEKKSRKRKAAPEADSGNIADKLSSIGPGNQEDDTWVTADVPADITGPVIILLPSAQSTCLACDTGGAVFASGLENIVENNPSTAEPHDVRQVWVAHRVAGTENISFKDHHGRYLGCDSIGSLSARNEAISPEESFLCIASVDTPGTFSIQTQRDKFLAIKEQAGSSEIRGDAESISFNTTLRIRMQARFKPRLKADKESKAKEKISRKELEEVVGRKLADDEVRKLKRARVQGDYHEAILDVRVKGKHDKYS